MTHVPIHAPPIKKSTRKGINKTRSKLATQETRNRQQATQGDWRARLKAQMDKENATRTTSAPTKKK